MDFDTYVNELAQAPEAESHLELDRERELKYLRYAAFRFRYTAQLLPKTTEPLRVLDIGTTPFTLYVKKANPHFEVFTLDRTELLKERCSSNGVELRTCDLDSDALPFPDDFLDVVIFTEVLEHVFRPPSEILSEVRRILKPGGTLILSVPNIAYILNRVRLMLGRTHLEDPDEQLRKTWVHGHGHLHEYTLSEIVSVVGRVGFEVQSKRYLQRGVGEALRDPYESLPRRIYNALEYAGTRVLPSTAPQMCLVCKA
jgi:SAM-dependent methyltransferase